MGQGVVVHEQSRRQVKGHKHIDGVVLMGSQQEKYSEQVEAPRHNVDVIVLSWCICGEKEKKSHRAIKKKCLLKSS